MTYLLDSGIIAELASQNPNPNVLRWLESKAEETMYISVVTLAEISEQIEKENSLSKKNRLYNWLNNDLIIRFGGRICEISVGVSLKWGEIIAKFKGLSHSLTLADSLNLAIALVYDHTLVTHNIAIFEDTGIRVINPYENNI
jgi:predicted nucleic acid-binding protein